MDEHENPDAPAGKSRKYAQRERERRFLIAGLPPGEIVRTQVLTDRYIDGTRIRLRRPDETSASGSSTTYKLTQKVPAADGSPGLITTFYVNEAEYARLSELPARVLSKTRYSIPPFGVDVFGGELAGLFIAEVEFDSEEELRSFATPTFAIAEVTHDPRFTGARWTTTRRAELLELLASFGLRLERGRP